MRLLKILKIVLFLGSLFNFIGFILGLSVWNGVFAIIWFLVAITIEDIIKTKKANGIPIDCRKCKHFKSITTNAYKCEKDYPPCLKDRRM